MQLPSYEQIAKWDFGGWLVKTTADYYLTMDTYLHLEDVSQRRAAAYEREWRAVAYEMATGIARYLVLACGGELRHKGSWSVRANREQVWGLVSGWLTDRPDDFLADVLDTWAVLFKGSGFGGSVGGKPWAQACTLTAAWLRKEYSDVIFVEMALNLHHNCAIIFNKRPLDNGAYLLLLSAGAEGLHIDKNADLILKHGSVGRTNTWLNKVRGSRKARAHEDAKRTEETPSMTETTSGESPPPPVSYHQGTTEKVW